MQGKIRKTENRTIQIMYGFGKEHRRTGKIYLPVVLTKCQTFFQISKMALEILCLE